MKQRFGKKGRRRSVLFVVSLFLFSQAPLLSLPRVQDGDIIFQTSRSRQSKAIQLATHSPYSHMGIIFHVKGRPMVLEAVEPVRYTPLRVWIAKGVAGRFALRRLKRARELLTPATVRQMKRVGDSFLGRSYDAHFQWSDDRLYCSELVWKIYDRVLDLQPGSLQELREFDLTHPVVKKMLRQRYGRRIPYHEPVISPEAIFRSPLLQEP